MQQMTGDKTILRVLGDNLILRRSTPADAGALADFHARYLGEGGPDHPEEALAAWTRDLLRGDHPTFGAGDFTLVEDTRTGAIVSSLNLISQTWTYAGIPFGVGRPELVATHPDYRNRGLVRAQFEVIHRWSAERGQSAQAITGIPWFYRQFGYEYALELGGGRSAASQDVPELKDGQAEPFRVRPAAAADLPFVAQVYDHAERRRLISCVRDEALWGYELSGRSRTSANARALCVIEAPDAEPVGYLVHPFRLWHGTLVANWYELKPGASWLSVTPSVMRYLRAMGERFAARDGEQAFREVGFWNGTQHPVYDFFADRLRGRRHPYAWYVRVPDLPGFLQRLQPVLERRLAESNAAGYTGELKVSFYREGLQLAFAQGRLARVEAWKPGPGDDGKARFPDLTFLQLLFGRRSLEELSDAFADCWVDEDADRFVLETLFPKRSSDVWPIA